MLEPTTENSEPGTHGVRMYESELQTLGGGTVVASNVAGHSGTGYADLGGSGSYVEFGEVVGYGSTDGPCELRVRYTQAGSTTRPCSVTLNGQLVGELSFPQTASWTDWQTEAITTTCAPGTNVIRVTALTSSGGPNLDNLEVSIGSEVRLWGSEDCMVDIRPVTWAWQGNAFVFQSDESLEVISSCFAPGALITESPMEQSTMFE